MKIALLGNGKTGSYIEKSHNNVVSFNTNNKPTKNNLSECDIVISFLPGDVFLEHIPLLIETRLPVITGSTGFEWPINMQKKLEELNLTWIRSNNFSLGMNIVKAMIEKLSLIEELDPSVKFTIDETHHIKKLDAPSGTALSFDNWLGKKADIRSQRIGDVIGIHEIKAETSIESISLTHTALDRSLFAKGAIWAATKVHTQQQKSGLINFNQLVNQHIGI